MIHLRALIARALGPPTPSGQVVALAGDAGMGKTRLADEALHELRATYPSVLCIRDSCQSYEQALPYAPIVRLLRQMLTLTPADDPADQAMIVQQQLTDLVPDWSRFAPLLGPLLGLPLPDTTLTAALTDEQRRDLLHDGVVRLCVALAVRRPLVLLLDDLQWADASTQALVAQLATGTAGQPVLLVLIYRPLPGLPDSWRDLPHTTVIRLRELSRADSETLMRALLNAAPPPELLPFIERADGSPFFIEETLRYLLGTGALVRDERGAWTCTRPLDQGAVPGQVEQLITARLDRLDQGARALAQLAAVIGPRFSERLMAAMTRDRHLLKLHLEELVQTGFLMREDGPAPPIYRFKHVLVHEVVYGSLLFARRRELHAGVAAAIAQVYAGELDAHRAVLAQHYRDAEQWEPAFTHFVAAAGQAQARYAHSEALALYHEALAVAPWRDRALAPADLGEAAVVYENLGDVLTITGDYDEARGAYERLLALLEADASTGRPAHQAALQRKVGRSYEHQGDFIRALDWYARAEQTLAAVAPGTAPLERARVLSDSGWVHFRQGNMDQARACLEQALEHAGPAAYDEQARILNRLGGVAWARGDLLLAQHYVQRSLAACEHSGDLLGQANALNNLGLITERQGHAADAVRYGMQAMEHYERIGDRRMLAVAANNVGYALYNNDQYAQARDYLAQALDRASEVHDTYHQMIARLNLGRVLTALRQWDGAEASLQACLALAVELNLPAPQLEAHVALGTLALQQGDLAAAAQAQAAAAPLATDPTGEEYGRFQRFAAGLALAQGDPASARRLLATNEILFIRLHNLPEAARTRKLLLALTDAPAAPRPAPHLGLDDPGSAMFPA
jgi:predicted ATPase